MKEVGGLKPLFQHLKYIHQVTSGTSTQIICSQDGCFEQFNYASTYKRHLLSVHVRRNEEQVDEPEAQPERPHLAQEVEDDMDMDIEPNVDDNQIQAQTTFEDISEATGAFIANMKASTSVPYLFVDTVTREVEELTNVIVNHLEGKVTSLLDDIKNGDLPDDAKCEEILQTFSELKEPFRGMRTQKQQDDYFKKKGVFIEPVPKILGGEFVTASTSTGGVRQVFKEEHFQYVPIGKTLKKHLEQPGVMTAILTSKASEDNDLIKSYRDGTYFNRKYGESDDIIIPLLLYNDDFESGNPLGSRKGKNKISGFYVSLLCLPMQYQAKLSNILLAACAKSSSISKYGVDEVLSVLVKDIQILENNGLTISCSDFEGNVRPILFQVIGDNLGLHHILGFVCSFSANFPCRICRAPKELTRRQLEEDIMLLRNEENFAEDLLVNNVSLTGVKRDSKLNKLANFHVTDNEAPDVMHDFLEGVLPLEIKLIISTLIEEEYFTLEELNTRLAAFNYGFVDMKNKPSPIQASALANPSGPSGQSAAQTNCLALYLPMIIGDLVDEDSEVWELFLLLLDVYKLVVAPSISKGGTIVLKGLIREHHSLYLQLFETHLIPKHHFITHYPRLIRRLGPLMQYSCIRKEGKHKPFKQWARASNNFKNIARTVSIRHQQQQSYHFLMRNPLSAEVDIKHPLPMQVSMMEDAGDICAALNCPADSILIMAESVNIHSYVFKPECMVLTDWSEDGPHFSKLEHIILLASKMYFVLRPWLTTHHVRHMHAHAVQSVDGPIHVKEPHDLLICRPFHVTKCFGGLDLCWYIVAPFNLI